MLFYFTIKMLKSDKSAYTKMRNIAFVQNWDLYDEVGQTPREGVVGEAPSEGVNHPREICTPLVEIILL